MKKKSKLKIFTDLSKRGQTKGVSPVVATVLLIVLVVAIALIVFLWFRELTQESITKFGGKNIALVCDDVVFEASYSIIEERIYVSNYGNVRSCERTYTRKDGAIVKKRLRQRSLVVDNLGYVKVELHYHKRECFKVHRLVLLTFVGNKNLPINHIDGNKKNNRLDNLEYCTYGHNLQHCHDNDLRPKTHYNKIICNDRKF